MPKSNENMRGLGLIENPVTEWTTLVLLTTVLNAAESIKVAAQTAEPKLKSQKIGEQILLIISALDTVINVSKDQVAGLHGYLHHSLLNIVPVLVKEVHLEVSDLYALVAPAILHLSSRLRTQQTVMPLGKLDEAVRKAGATMPAIYTTTG